MYDSINWRSAKDVVICVRDMSETEITYVYL
jgi:hypothetical protein